MNTSPEEVGFLSYLAANEDDLTARGAYADWLDEQERYEDAARQRAWPEAKAWLISWVAGINYEKDDPHTYADAIEAGHAAVKGEGFTFSTTSGSNWFYGNQTGAAEFFRNWSIVTGKAVPESVIENPPFSCSC